MAHLEGDPPRVARTPPASRWGLRRPATGAERRNRYATTGKRTGAHGGIGDPTRPSAARSLMAEASWLPESPRCSVSIDPAN